MPADASIYGLIRPMERVELEKPEDIQLKRLRLAQLTGQEEMQRLQTQQARKGIADDEATSQAYREAAGDTNKLRTLLYGRGLYKPAQAAEKAALDAQKTRGDIGKTQAETEFKKAETLLKHTAYLRDRLASIPDGDNQGFAVWREEGMRLLGPEVFRSVPQVLTPELRTGLMRKADDLIVPLAKQLELKMQQRGQDITMRGQDVGSADTRRGQDITASTTRRGQDIGAATAAAGQNQPVYDSERGVFVTKPVGGAAAVVKPGAGTGQELPGKAPTESQGRASMFGTRAMESDKILKELEDKISTAGLAIKRGMENVPLVGGATGALANTVLSADQQRVEQAQRDFVNAVLRQESGAVISPSEFENAQKQYFPQPGDSKAVIEQKRRNRETAINGFKTMAGPAGGKIKAAPGPQGASGGIKFLGFE